AFLGCEALDITEIAGADSLYEASGILGESERNASRLFGSRRTLFSTEGSSQCIRAMLYLALTNRPCGARPVVVAARNVHKAFIYAAALLDFEIVWLWPPHRTSLCACEVTPDALARTLDSLPEPPAAVYLTSPDYLGGQADIASLADICHGRDTILAVDNAHGAYLHFLSASRHPLDLGADICCDSAHKTLPALTGAAYLHIAHRAPRGFAENAKGALALFGSTSPSYLTLASLDLCNAYLADGYAQRLAQTVRRIDDARAQLSGAGYALLPSDPLKLTIDAAACGASGAQLAARLRSKGIECEYADPDALVLMLTPENSEADLSRLVQAFGRSDGRTRPRSPLPNGAGERVLSVRQALFSAHETIPAMQSLGRICGAPTVSCPPAIPIAVSGEIITPDALALFERYGVSHVDVVAKRP
ncbi:MAG: amino acid decarboxylase, partial [Clostridia bacterium]|nr:amino acid decarboxylase [Clostridia bacterium]